MNSVMMKYEELNKKLAGKVEVTQYGARFSLRKRWRGVQTSGQLGLSNLSMGTSPLWKSWNCPLVSEPMVASHVTINFTKFKKILTITIAHAQTSPVNVVQTLSKPVKTLDDIEA